MKGIVSGEALPSSSRLSWYVCVLGGGRAVEFVKNESVLLFRGWVFFKMFSSSLAYFTCVASGSCSDLHEDRKECKSHRSEPQKWSCSRNVPILSRLNRNWKME